MTTGIDTKSIISQLMQLERLPQQRLQSRITELNAVRNAWSQIGDKLKTVNTAADALSGLGAVAKLLTATTSDESAIAVRVTGSAAAGSVTPIQVLGLAKSHSVAADDVFTTADADLGGRTLTIDVDGTAHTITPTGGGLDDLVTAINQAGIGVRAATVKVGDNAYRLSLTAASTGAANSFTVSGTGWTGFTTTRTGADALLDVGGITVTRASNTISDLIDGVELTLRAETTSDVEVAVKQDVDAVVAKVKGLVDSVNTAIDLINAATKSDTSGGGSKGPLAGNSTARNILLELRNVIASAIPGADGADHTASELGVQLTREGKLTFDDTALRDSLAEDPESVFAALGKGISSGNAKITAVGITSSAVVGSNNIEVTAAGTVGILQGVAVPLAPPGQTVTLNVAMNGAGPAPVTFTVGATWAETVAAFNSALVAAGFGHVTASTDGSSITLTNSRYGSAETFTVTDDPTNPLGLSGTATGTDVEAVVNGVAMTGTGRTLVVDGVVLSIALDAADLGGGSVATTYQVTEGLAGALGRIATTHTKASTGSVDTARESVNNRIRDLEGRVERYDDILALREMALVRKYAAMEQLIARFQSSMSSLGGLSSFQQPSA